MYCRPTTAAAKVAERFCDATANPGQFSNYLTVLWEHSARPQTSLSTTDWAEQMKWRFGRQTDRQGEVREEDLSAQTWGMDSPVTPDEFNEGKEDRTVGREAEFITSFL